MACPPASSQSQSQVQERILSTYVWLDYWSIPQPSFEVDEAKRADATEAMKRAVDSIPAFAARATLFVVLCPPVLHRELQEVCDLGFWFRRAWCRLEVISVVMQMRTLKPAIVCKGELQGHRTLLDVWYALSSPGHGELSCCRLNHERWDS